MFGFEDFDKLIPAIIAVLYTPPTETLVFVF